MSVVQAYILTSSFTGRRSDGQFTRVVNATYRNKLSRVFIGFGLLTDGLRPQCPPVCKNGRLLR